MRFLRYSTQMLPSIIFWVFNPSINLQVKDVKNFPIIFAEDNRVGNMAKTNTEICEQDWNSYETASGFKKHPLI